MSSYLQSLVLHKCTELGAQAAGEFFDVSPALVKQWLAGSKTPSLAAVERVFQPPEAAPKDAGWEGKEVFLCLPQYKFTNPLTLFSTLAIWDRSKFRAGMRFNDALIVHARNALADDFLSTNVPWSWWLDDDTVPPMGSASWFNQYTGHNWPEPFASFHGPTRLRTHGKSIVSGLYTGRDVEGRAVYAEALVRSPAGDAENKFAHEGPHDILKPTEWAGFGCMLVHRDVFLAIKEKYPHLAPQRGDDKFHFFSNVSDALVQAVPELKSKLAAAQEEAKGGSHEKLVQLLQDAVRQIEDADSRVKRESVSHQGEDRTFCLRARNAGHQTFVDLGLVCGHVGPNVWHIKNTRA